MKTLIVEEKSHGRRTEVPARATYETEAGKWTAEVDDIEFRRACRELCSGIGGCDCEDLHIEADQDDDGKEYSIMRT